MALDELARDRMIAFATAEYEFWLKDMKADGKLYDITLSARYKQFCKFYDTARGAEGRKSSGVEQ